MSHYLIVQPSGVVESHPWPETEALQLAVMQLAVDGSIEYIALPFHNLQAHEAVLNDDGFERLPVNWPAHRLLGMPEDCMPPCGPVVIVPLPEGQDNRAERAHQCRYFGTLDAVALGLVEPAEVGLGVLIDLRQVRSSG